MFLIAGISGSGKTHTTRALAALDGQWNVVRASGLLADAGRPLRPLSVEDAIQNQWRLMELMRESGLLGHDDVVLDGHVTVETTAGMINIPDEWYDAACLEGIAHVVSDPADIAGRRRSRGLPIWTEAEAEGFQVAERQEAQSQAGRLGLPYLDLPSGNAERLRRWMGEISSAQRR